MTPDTSERQICGAFAAIADYAFAQGWAPIGFRSFHVGPWEVTVNQTRDRRDDLDPFHARVVHESVVAIMILSPFGGSVGGWQGAEAAFLADLAAATHGLSATDHRRA